MERSEYNQKPTARELFDILTTTGIAPLGSMTKDMMMTVFYALAKVESGFNTAAKSPYSTAFGIWQMIKDSWKQAGYSNLDTSDSFFYSPSLQARAYSRYVKTYIAPICKEVITNFATAAPYQFVTVWVQAHHDGGAYVKRGEYRPEFFDYAEKVCNAIENPAKPFTAYPELTQNLRKIISAARGKKNAENKPILDLALKDTARDITKSAGFSLPLAIAAVVIALLIFKKK